MITPPSGCLTEPSSEPARFLPTVLVMLKAPRAGAVKTRLAAEVGVPEATRIYRLLVERQMATVPPDWPVEVFFAPADAREEMRAWLGSRPDLHPQVEGDLGQRLASAVDAACARGACGVLVIGGDCPSLDEAALRAAGDGLRTHEVVLGPASDGGYYLLGLARPQPELFVDIPWSTEGVFPATRQKIQALGLNLSLLPVRDDVDTLADLLRYKALFWAGASRPSELALSR